MFRLRTTTALSLAALAVGIAGTQWLSGLTSGWAGPSERVAGYLPAPRHALRRERSAPPRVVGAHRAVRLASESGAIDEAPPAVPELVPLTMPATTASWSQMDGHVQGNVLVHLRIDGSGQVAAAAIATSSGDPVLDARALASVRQWRFAVPAGYPDGFSGDLPMRFTAGDRQVAQTP